MPGSCGSIQLSRMLLRETLTADETGGTTRGMDLAGQEAYPALTRAAVVGSTVRLDRTDDLSPGSAGPASPPLRALAVDRPCRRDGQPRCCLDTAILR